MTTKACCEGGVPKAEAASAGKLCGKLVELESSVTGKKLTCYEVGQGDKAVVAVYDIFGFSVARTKEVCDQISKAGFRVILPDFFRGTDVLKEFGVFPPEGGIEAVVEWVTKTAPFDATVREVFDVVIKHLESQSSAGKVDVGLVGFCWGGKIGLLSSAKENGIKAAVGIHPSFLQVEDATNATCPQMFLPAGNDPPIDPIWDALQSKPFADKCFKKVFQDMAHGWSLRSDMSDAVQGPQANEAIELAIKFFKDNL